MQYTSRSYKNNGSNVAIVTVYFQNEVKSTHFSEFMPFKRQEFLIPHEFLKDFTEVKDFELNPPSFKHRNKFNQLNY